ncbi:MAG: DUF6252 family protein [Bacteroidota bacterium]
MNYMKWLNILIAFVALLPLYSCKEDLSPSDTDYPLAEPGFLAANINDFAWKSDPFKRNAGLLNEDDGAYATYGTFRYGAPPDTFALRNYLEIRAKQEDDTVRKHLSFYVYNVTGTGTKTTSSGELRGYFKHRLQSSTVFNDFSTEGMSGTLRITKLDTINHLISGTFEFTARHVSNKEQIMHFTKGSFTDVILFSFE